MDSSTLAARAFGAAAISVAVLASASGPAWATSGSSTQAGLEARAQQIASQIQADGRQLDQLGEQYGAAQLHYQQLQAQEAELSVAMAATTRAVAQARQALKEQALLAYLAGGAPFTAYVPSRPSSDPSLKAAYAEIVSKSQQRAVADLRAALAQQGRQDAELARARRQSVITLRDLRADQAAAGATLAAQRQALAQVKGQLAVLVAQAQAARQKAEQAAVRASLAQRRQLPPGPAASTTTSRPVAVPRRSTTTLPAPVTTNPPAPRPAPAPPASGARAAIAYARAQLGKPYQWAGAGPDSFDCSGLTMMAWEQAGVYFPHLAQAQYDMTARIPIAGLAPGDLVFYGTPSDVYHVGLYIGNGNMIDAPETGQNVSIQSIYWDGLLGGGRVTS